MKYKIHRFLGKFIGVGYRKWYYKHNDKAIWGIMDMLRYDGKHKPYEGNGFSMMDFTDLVRATELQNQINNEQAEQR